MAAARAPVAWASLVEPSSPDRPDDLVLRQPVFFPRRSWRSSEEQHGRPSYALFPHYRPLYALLWCGSQKQVALQTNDFDVDGGHLMVVMMANLFLKRQRQQQQQLQQMGMSRLRPSINSFSRPTLE
jgi:hypothetical protein